MTGSLAAGNAPAAVSVVILTRDEALNLPFALASLKGWSDDIHVVDSGSTDGTCEIGRAAGAQLHFHAWEGGYAFSRNWALENCLLRHEWVLFLDADEQLTDASRAEIAQRTAEARPDCRGFHLQFDYVFLGAPLRLAMQPHLRLARREGLRWFPVRGGSSEFCNVPLSAPSIRARLIHHDHRGIGGFIEKLNRNATLEARELWARRHGGPSATSESPQRGGLRHRAWLLLERRLPGFLQVTAFFGYRLLFRTDVRDGWAGFLFTFYYAFWYRLLIDSKYQELRARQPALLPKEP